MAMLDRYTITETLHDLQETLMRLVLEHAGAQRAFLLLVEGEGLEIHAHAEIAGEETHVSLAPALPVSAATLPMSILDYVRRTGESVILADAVESIYASDEYIARQKPRSVLCLPILRRAHMGGILYLENNLIAGAFTSNTLTALELLAAQAAVSLDNARLYTDLQQENAERQQAEETLRESREYLRQIIDCIADPIFVKDQNHRFVHVNKAQYELAGVSREEMLGKFDYDFFPKEQVDIFWKQDDLVLEAGVENVNEEEINDARGNTRTIVTKKRLLIDQAGNKNIVGVIRDITEQKQAEEATKESEEQLRLVFEAAKIGTGELDLQTHQITFSNALQRVLGLAPGTLHLTFEEYIERVHPEDRAHLSQVVENVIAGQPTKAGQSDIAIDYRIVWPDGSVHWTTSRAKVFYDGAGHAIRIVAALTDITERKQAEEALRESEAYLAQAQRLSHTGSWAWNVATREFVHWSQEHFRMYNLDPKMGIPSWEAAQQLIHPEDRAKCLESIDRAIRERMDCILDYRAVLPDGTIKYIDSIGHPVFNASGHLVEFIGTEMDVTERKRVEAHQTMQYAVTRVLAESASLAEATPQLLQVICESLGWEMGEFWSVDRDADLIRWRAVWHVPALDVPEFMAVSRQTAYVPGFGLPGRAWQSGQPAWIPDLMADPNFLRAAVAALAGLRSACVFPILLGSQTLGVMLFLSRELRPPDEALLQVMSAISSQMGQFFERKRAEEALRRAHDELEIKVAERTAELAVAKERAIEADRLKSAFLATMSHELRTPLNSIIGFTGIMLQGLVGPLNDEQNLQLGMVKNSARHLLDLINDVLDLSKIEAGQMELRPELFDMRALIEKTVQTLAPLAKKKKLKLVTDVALEVDRVLSDPRRVEQILINLVNNAIKFTEQGQVCIECRVHNGWLLTSVADTGIGIKPEDMGKLFTTFQQLDSTLGRKHEGTGLGLAISQKLAGPLGGEIRVESTWGVGSTFTFVLPLNKQGG
jgi:PAS domain S-box-containing protein